MKKTLKTISAFALVGFIFVSQASWQNIACSTASVQAGHTYQICN